MKRRFELRSSNEYDICTAQITIADGTFRLDVEVSEKDTESGTLAGAAFRIAKQRLKDALAEIEALEIQVYSIETTS